MESSAETFALFLRLESIRVSFAAAIDERLAQLIVYVVVKRGDVAVARARIDGRVTNRTLRGSFHRNRRDVRGYFCSTAFLALALAGFFILEAILVALAAAVLELVAGI